MKTQSCQLLAYCETQGAPVGISEITHAKEWISSDQDESLYWDVVDQIGTNLLFKYNEKFSFFNTETGNFIFLRSVKELVIAEIVSIEDDAAIPWRGIEFDIIPNTDSKLTMNGLICFFDATVGIPKDILPIEAICNTESQGVWNTVTLECNYTEFYEVSFKSSLMQLQGICFANN